LPLAPNQQTSLNSLKHKGFTIVSGLFKVLNLPYNRRTALFDFISFSRA
jgi:hypothetical protein